MSLLNDDESRELAWIAKNVGAVRFGEFTLASGKKSDFYFDGRRVTLSNVGLCLVARAIARAAQGAVAIGGPATAAVPMVAGYLSRYSLMEAGLPQRGFYVRQEPKAHGLGNVIEGLLNPGDKVLLVDDTLTSGGSLVKAAAAVRAAGAEVMRVMVLLDREEGGAETIRKELGVEVVSAITRKALEAFVKAEAAT